MTEPREFKVGDRVHAEFSHGNSGGVVSAPTARHSGTIVELTDSHAVVQCAGFLARIERGVLQFTDG